VSLDCRVHSAMHCSIQPCLITCVMFVCWGVKGYTMSFLFVTSRPSCKFSRDFFPGNWQTVRPFCLLSLHLQRHRTDSFPVPDSFVDSSVASLLVLSFCVFCTVTKLQNVHLLQATGLLLSRACSAKAAGC